jgi:hypothetical protein
MTLRLRTISTVALAAIVCVADGSYAQAPAADNARTWIGREKELEDFLKSAKVVSQKEIGTGVTRPKRATFAPGGPIESMAWKPIKPGRYTGYWESYKSEIAAYELDKFFALGMIPPTVERQVDGETGAAVMWASPTQSFKDLGGVPGSKGVKAPPPARMGIWNLQLVRAKMFDNLIGNIDPNLGNWLVDPSWNLILIDHTRSFTTTKNLYHQLASIDDGLWEKMKALDEATLTKVVGAWLDSNAIKGILDRRDKMQEAIAKMKRD